MAAFFLPCQSTLPHFTFQCDLDGVTYGFEFEWNERVGAWFMSIYDVNGTPLLSSLRVVVGFPLAARSRYMTAMPPGAFVATDTSGQNQDPGLSDLGNRVQILYFSTVEDGQ